MMGIEGGQDERGSRDHGGGGGQDGQDGQDEMDGFWGVSAGVVLDVGTGSSGGGGGDGLGTGSSALMVGRRGLAGGFGNSRAGDRLWRGGQAPTVEGDRSEKLGTGSNWVETPPAMGVSGRPCSILLSFFRQRAVRLNGPGRMRPRRGPQPRCGLVREGRWAEGEALVPRPTLG